MLAEMCPATLSSMNHVTHESFVAVIQTVVDHTVHAGGRVDARELVPGVKTISQRLEERANEARAEVLASVKEAIDDGRCSCSTDMWTEDFGETNFIDIYAYYSSKDCSGQ